MDILETKQLREKMKQHPRLNVILDRLIRGDMTAPALHHEMNHIISLVEPERDDICAPNKSINPRKKILICSKCLDQFSTMGMINLCRKCKAP